LLQLIGWNNKSGKNLLNSMIIPAVRLSQIAATTGADLTNFVLRILNISFMKVFKNF
tara:strand:+ start:587 stop:757 length:171 start_codon:yes stop_codon:yes gene_type:complete